LQPLPAFRERKTGNRTASEFGTKPDFFRVKYGYARTLLSPNTPGGGRKKVVKVVAWGLGGVAVLIALGLGYLYLGYPDVGWHSQDWTVTVSE